MQISGTRHSFQAAVDRARALEGHRRVQLQGGDTYRVIGRRGDLYTVVVDRRGDFWCSCPAGTQGSPCWHAAATWIKRLGQQAAGSLPVAPRQSAEQVRQRLLAESRANIRRHGYEGDTEINFRELFGTRPTREGSRDLVAAAR